MMVNAATALHKILVSGALCFMGWSKKEGHSKVQLRFCHSREEQFLPGEQSPKQLRKGVVIDSYTEAGFGVKQVPHTKAPI